VLVNQRSTLLPDAEVRRDTAREATEQAKRHAVGKDVLGIALVRLRQQTLDGHSRRRWTSRTPGTAKNQIDADAGPAEHDAGKSGGNVSHHPLCRLRPWPRSARAQAHCASQRSGWQVIGCMDAVEFLTPYCVQTGFESCVSCGIVDRRTNRRLRT